MLELPKNRLYAPKLPPPAFLAGFAVGLSSLAVSIRIGLNIPQMNECDWWYYYG